MATRGGGVYFPVDAGFCDTMVARMIVRRLGAEGFEAYVRMLCCLLNEPGGRLPLAMDDEWEVLSERLGMDEDAARELVAVLAHYGAVVLEDGALWSPLVAESIAARDEISEKRRKAAEARWAKDKKREEPKE